ncbi:GGDEF domain-containing protein [Telmatospirillum siberiense]|uniref:GGDEF domain-containing protein n=1 Tax=Telmatospirillum siberiense TaxID=382514 RepID=UPI00237A9C12|nr:GGDEF domain-containing protein [Telmatospirillum siberiense]
MNEDGVAILFIDLDNFKQVNDTHGPEKRDEILRSVGKILRSILRDKDVAGRMGGDEFVICVSARREVIQKTAMSIAQRIITGTNGVGYGIGCSIGIALITSPQDTIASTIKCADAAMYEAKKLGKNRFILFGTSN